MEACAAGLAVPAAGDAQDCFTGLVCCSGVGDVVAHSMRVSMGVETERTDTNKIVVLVWALRVSGEDACHRPVVCRRIMQAGGIQRMMSTVQELC